VTSVGAKIYVGFAVIVLLLMANGAVGYFGAHQLRDASEGMQQVARVNAAVLEIDRDVQELRLRVNRYIASGYASARQDVERIGKRLFSRIEAATRERSGPVVRDSFERMAGHLREYLRQFESVVSERQLRADLVQRQLPATSAAITARLNQLSSHYPQGHANRLALLRCETSFSQAEKLFLRYYGMPDTVFLNDALEQLHHALEIATVLEVEPPAADLKDQLIADLVELEHIGVRAVQATRSYLFFVNVVMAGEASEVAYYSAQVRSISDERQDEIARQVASTTRTVNRRIGIGVAAALAVALLIAARLAFLIVPPITALTSTFKRLAAGETNVEVPRTQRQDEIGQMTLAARVFSDQNRRTRELLEESKQLGQQLSRKATELEATNADLDSFAYVASHDLKSPLRGIRQLATWIQEDAGELLPDKSLAHLQAMVTRVGRMEMLLQDLLDYSRIGRTETELEEVDLDQLLAGILELIDNPAGVTVRWPREASKFSTNRIPLEQVLLNLIGNAVKHNEKGRDGTVEVQWETFDDKCQFRVRDNGPGIARQHHERIFQMYQRVGSAEVDGSGMGLAIVKKQVELVGGSIQVHSALGEGAEFQFQWPIYPLAHAILTQREDSIRPRKPQDALESCAAGGA
jgi:signal transduction histidine kinase